MKKVIPLFILIFIISKLYSVDYKKIDDFYTEGKYTDGLSYSLKEFDKNKPDIALIWRISRFYLEIGDESKTKKEKIDSYTKGMDFAAPYYENNNAGVSDKAQLFFWYTANFASKSKAIGIFESISTLPELFELVEKNIKIDPAFAPPYLLKGRIDVEVPGFLGGDDFRMGESFALALKYNSNDLNVLVDAADGFVKRNWDANKKLKEKEKRQKSDGTPENLSDKEYAKQLLDKAVSLYKSLEKPTKRETVKYNEGLELLKKL
ncbi:MAG: hypothetical protein JXB50_08590 [Spirochaetes bacterium]|nr:hypothetical protein [Spirochaetota bacterium]